MDKPNLRLVAKAQNESDPSKPYYERLAVLPLSPGARQTFGMDGHHKEMEELNAIANSVHMHDLYFFLHPPSLVIGAWEVKDGVLLLDIDWLYNYQFEPIDKSKVKYIDDTALDKEPLA